MNAYTFDYESLPVLADSSKTPVVVIGCGSFSPVTNLHLRLFELAYDHYKHDEQDCELICGIYSPVGNSYRKKGLIDSFHRVKMCKLAINNGSNSVHLLVDEWESLQPNYTPTLLVLEHFDQIINVHNGGIKTKDGNKIKAKIKLLAGGDLVESFNVPGLWSSDDLERIMSKYGLVIVERTGVDLGSVLFSNDFLFKYRKNISLIKQLIHNDISSTKIRLFIKRQMSIKYLLPDSVIQYIKDNRLYFD